MSGKQTRTEFYFREEDECILFHPDPEKRRFSDESPITVQEVISLVQADGWDGRMVCTFDEDDRWNCRGMHSWSSEDPRHLRTYLLMCEANKEIFLNGRPRTRKKHSAAELLEEFNPSLGENTHEP